MRRALLDAAASVTAEQGLAALSIRAVATRAGVTTGALIHHFPSRQALIDGVFDDFIQGFDGLVSELMRTDLSAPFSRAYVDAVFQDPSFPAAPLATALLSEESARKSYADWLEARLARTTPEERDAGPTAARLAADGLWMAEITRSGGAPESLRPALHAALTNLIEGEE